MNGELEFFIFRFISYNFNGQNNFQYMQSGHMIIWNIFWSIHVIHL